MEWSKSWLIYLPLLLVGLSLGSFLNVVIYRLPLGKSIIKPRSFCPACGKTIPFYYNIPVISYLMLRGRCKFCGVPISPRYLIVELLSGAVVVGFFAWLGPTWACLGYTLFTLALIAIFAIDCQHYIIPDQITYAGMAVGLLFALLNPRISFASALIGLAVGGGGLLLIGLLGDWLFKKESLGGGDIKLAAMLGAFLGWQKILFVFIAAPVMGLLISLIILPFSRSVRESRKIPFGPFLAVAAVMAILFGDKLIMLYIRQFRAF